MTQERTTVVVQEFLDELAGKEGEASAESVVQAVLERAVHRLQHLCSSFLYRNYPRLTRPPLNLQPEEVLGAVVERLIKAMRAVRPRDVRQFFALVNQHVRWELNDLARRLDQQTPFAPLPDDALPAPPNSGSELSSNARRILDAIDGLPSDVGEAFSLVRIQGLSVVEAASVLGVSPKTVRRRLGSSLLLLEKQLSDLNNQSASGN